MRQCFDGAGVQYRLRAALRGGQPGEDGVGQQGQVLPAFAQRRHAQFDHIDAVVQVMPEAAFIDQCGQVFVGGRKNAHIHCDFGIGTHRAYRFFLDGAQQFDLHRHW